SGTGYITVAFNNQPAVPPAMDAGVVGLSVIKVGCGPYQGDVKVITPDSLFEEQVTLRHSGDFGGTADKINFEWFYTTPNPTCSPADLGAMPFSCSKTARVCRADNDCPTGETCIMPQACESSPQTCIKEMDCPAGETCNPTTLACGGNKTTCMYSDTCNAQSCDQCAAGQGCLPRAGKAK